MTMIESTDDTVIDWTLLTEPERSVLMEAYRASRGGDPMTDEMRSSPEGRQWAALPATTQRGFLRALKAELQRAGAER